MAVATHLRPSKGPLTPGQISKLKPGQTLRDEKVRGLHIRARQTVKSWHLYYRTKTGLERRPRLGEWPTLSIKDAREIARELLTKVAAGNDPIADWQSERAAPTVANLADRYEAEHAAKKKSAFEDYRLLNKFVRPALGSKRVNDPEMTEHVDRLLRKISERTPTQANRVRSLLSKMFNLAERWRMRPQHSNPCYGLERNQEKARKRYVTPEEGKKIAERLNVLLATEPAKVFAITLLALTGARRSEIGGRTLTRNGDMIVLREHKTQNAGEDRIIRLPAAAVRLIEDNGLDGHMLPSADSLTRFWTSEVCKSAGVENLRLHDLRHTFASATLAAGYELSVIGGLLGHKSTQTTKRYAHLMDKTAREAVAGTANVLETLFPKLLTANSKVIHESAE